MLARRSGAGHIDSDAVHATLHLPPGGTLSPPSPGTRSRLSAAQAYAIALHDGDTSHNHPVELFGLYTGSDLTTIGAVTNRPAWVLWYHLPHDHCVASAGPVPPDESPMFCEQILVVDDATGGTGPYTLFP